MTKLLRSISLVRLMSMLAVSSFLPDRSLHGDPQILRIRLRRGGHSGRIESAHHHRRTPTEYATDVTVLWLMENARGVASTDEWYSSGQPRLVGRLLNGMF